MLPVRRVSAKNPSITANPAIATGPAPVSPNSVLRVTTQPQAAQSATSLPASPLLQEAAASRAAGDAGLSRRTSPLRLCEDALLQTKRSLLEPNSPSGDRLEALLAKEAQRWEGQLEVRLREQERTLQARLEAQQEAQARQHQEAMELEVREREEICHMLLTYLEDKVQEERQRWEQRLQEEQRAQEEQMSQLFQRCERDIAAQLSAQKQSSQKALQEGLAEERKRCEEGLCASEQVVQTHLSSLVTRVEEHCAQELLAARQSVLQSLLELRQELVEGLRSEREAREKLSECLALLERTTAAPVPAPVPSESRSSRKEDDYLAARAMAEWRCEQEQQLLRLRELNDGLDAKLGSLENNVYRELEKTASQSREVLAALGSTRGSLGACSEEVGSLREGLERLREQAAGRWPTDAGAPSEEAAKELRAALEAEARLREEGDDQLLAHLRDLLREERQLREQGQRTLDLGVQSVKELLFIDSGKREERDRDIQIQQAKLDEDLETMKRQLALRSR